MQIHWRVGHNKVLEATSLVPGLYTARYDTIPPADSSWVHATHELAIPRAGKFQREFWINNAARAKRAVKGWGMPWWGAWLRRRLRRRLGRRLPACSADLPGTFVRLRRRGCFTDLTCTLHERSPRHITTLSLLAPAAFVDGLAVEALGPLVMWPWAWADRVALGYLASDWPTGCRPAIGGRV